MGTRAAALVTTVALLASAALAQDQPGGPPVAEPPAPAEAPPEIPPYVIRLPEVAGDAARAGGAPTVLVAIDGFLVATTEPRDAFRVHEGRLLRTRDRVDAIVGIRLGVVPGRGIDRPDAAMTDADARNLLALDIDAERTDCAKWLSRIDPVRCAVRIRLGAAAVPALPETLQLVEFVADGTRRGPEALPALAQARRIALYDFDFSNAPYSVRGAAIDERREARFRAAHADDSAPSTQAPSSDLASAIVS